MFKTRKSDGRVFNDNKQRSDKHHGSVKPKSGVRMDSKINNVREKTYSEQLLEVAPKGTKIYALVTKTNSDGDYRHIKLLMIDKRGEIIPVIIPDNKLAKNVKNEMGVYGIYGGGMDMEFDLVYKLGRLLHKDGDHFSKVGLD